MMKEICIHYQLETEAQRFQLWKDVRQFIMINWKQ